MHGGARVIHPDTEVRFIGEHVGCGVFATKAIRKGTLTYVWDPLEIEVKPDDPRMDDPVMGDLIERYSYIDPGGIRIMSWDHAKYVNHSCEPNTMSSAHGFEIAVRDIEAGEELTDEYGMFNLPEPMDCSCSSRRCRGRVQAVDLEMFCQPWDSHVREAMRLALDVEQPLWALVDPPTVRALTRLARWNEGYRSVRALRVDPADRAEPQEPKSVQARRAP
jgi:hypothetical protein